MSDFQEYIGMAVMTMLIIIFSFVFGIVLEEISNFYLCFGPC